MKFYHYDPILVELDVPTYIVSMFIDILKYFYFIICDKIMALFHIIFNLMH